jgi:hypothetical protein
MTQPSVRSSQSGSARITRLVFFAVLSANTMNALAEPIKLKYASVFEQYRPHDDPAVKSWREANDTVNRIGGWRTYLRQVQEAEPKASPSSSLSPSSSASPAQPTTSTQPKEKQ